MNFIDEVFKKATKVEYITVFETSDFSIFNLNPCNRKINEKKVKDFISVFSDIRNKNRKIRFEYQEFKNTYIQNCTNGKYQKMIDDYFDGLNFGLEEK